MENKTPIEIEAEAYAESFQTGNFFVQIRKAAFIAGSKATAGGLVFSKMFPPESHQAINKEQVKLISENYEIPEALVLLWHQVQIWYGDIQKKENEGAFLRRINKLFFNESLCKATESAGVDPKPQYPSKENGYNRGLGSPSDKLRDAGFNNGDQVPAYGNELTARQLIDKLQSENESLKAALKDCENANSELKAILKLERDLNNANH